MKNVVQIIHATTLFNSELCAELGSLECSETDLNDAVALRSPSVIAVNFIIKRSARFRQVSGGVEKMLSKSLRDRILRLTSGDANDSRRMSLK